MSGYGLIPAVLGAPLTDCFHGQRGLEPATNGRNAGSILRAKRRPVVPGRRRSGRIFAVARGYLSRSQRRKSARTSDTPSSHFVSEFGLGVFLSRPTSTAGWPGNISCRDKRGRKGDLDVPFRILSVTTLQLLILGILFLRIWLQGNTGAIG
jgi:hypothetical protein